MFQYWGRDHAKSAAKGLERRIAKRLQPPDRTRNFDKTRITAEHLIAAQAGQRDLQPGLCRSATDEIRVHSVSGRAIHRRKQPLDVRLKVRALHPNGLVVRAVLP